MKRLITLLLTVIFVLTACSPQDDAPVVNVAVLELPEYSSDILEDEAFIKHLKYDLATALEENEEIIVESIQTQYVSQEHIDNLENVSQEYKDELAYNSLENIYFGYKLSELDEYFGGLQYVFTVEDGKTVAIPITANNSIDAIYTIMKNTALGAGVILLCVTVSIVTGGAGAPVAVSAVNVIFTFAATSTASGAAIGIASGGIFNGAVELGSQISRGENIDWNEVGMSVALGASEGLKWGAIIGAFTGGVQGGLQLASAAKDVGTYGALKTANAGELLENGQEIHHVLPDAISNIKTSEGLAIKMSKPDHRMLTSTGYTNESIAFRAEMEKLINAGKLKEAYIMGFDDIIEKTGTKYLEEIAKLKILTGLF